jgi:hypothetical protein
VPSARTSSRSSGVVTPIEGIASDAGGGDIGAAGRTPTGRGRPAALTAGTSDLVAGPARVEDGPGSPATSAVAPVRAPGLGFPSPSSPTTTVRSTTGMSMTTTALAAMPPMPPMRVRRRRTDVVDAGRRRPAI